MVRRWSNDETAATGASMTDDGRRCRNAAAWVHHLVRKKGKRKRKKTKEKEKRKRKKKSDRKVILYSTGGFVRDRSRRHEREKCAASAASVAKDLGTAWTLAPRQDPIPRPQVTTPAS